MTSKNARPSVDPWPSRAWIVYPRRRDTLIGGGEFAEPSRAPGLRPGEALAMLDEVTEQLRARDIPVAVVDE